LSALPAFGAFWAGEGVGIEWPGGDLMLLGLLAFFGLLAWACSLLLDRRRAAMVLARSDGVGGDE
jgi:uncharacterized membrane protein